MKMVTMGGNAVEIVVVVLVHIYLVVVAVCCLTARWEGKGISNTLLSRIYALH